MKTREFDGSLSFSAMGEDDRGQVRLVIHDKEIRATLVPYDVSSGADVGYVHVRAGVPIEAKWGDPFTLRTGLGQTSARGIVLNPCPEDPEKGRPSRRIALLKRLSRDEKEMLLALTEEKGIQGLKAPELTDFCRLSRARIESLARQLEGEGSIRILSFSPFTAVSQKAMDFLRKRILSYIGQYHEKHADRRGIPLEKLEKRFHPAHKALGLALRGLAKEGDIRSEEGLVWLSGFEVPLEPEEKDILEELEKMFVEGEFVTASLDDIRRRFGLSAIKLQTLLSHLTEKKKIVKGKDGFILHSRWLEEIVERLRSSGKKELTVADFKALTGLSRKYAIPLLELLDEMGVTRRKGARRDIL